MKEFSIISILTLVIIAACTPKEALYQGWARQTAAESTHPASMERTETPPTIEAVVSDLNILEQEIGESDDNIDVLDLELETLVEEDAE